MNRQIPIYVQVAETLKGRILRNEYRFGEFISAAKDLEKEFGVSNITVRKAFDLLVREGYLKPRQGVGTQIVGQPEELVELEFSGSFWEWVNSAVTRYLKIQVEVVEIDTVLPPKRVAELLRVPDDALIWRMKRIRKIKGEPASFVINHALLSLMQNVEAAHFQEHTFLHVFQEICGVALSRVEQRVRASVADIDLSRQLGIQFGDPVFFVENTYFNHLEEPVEVSYLYFRGDRYIYKAARHF